MSELTGLCDICNKPSRHLNTCGSCGAKVCDKHYNSSKGVCSNCERGTQIPDIRKVVTHAGRKLPRTLE